MGKIIISVLGRGTDEIEDRQPPLLSAVLFFRMFGRRQAIDRTVIDILRFLSIFGPLAVFFAPLALASATVGGPDEWTLELDSYLPAIAASGVLLFPFGTYLIMNGVYRMFQARAARSWTHTTGEIVSSEVAATGAYGWYRPMVSFRYVAGCE